MRIKSIQVMSLAGIMTVIYGFFGLVLGAILSFMAVLGMEAPVPSAGMGASLGILSVIIFPFVYAVGGFIGGVLTATFYNMAAKWTGGLVFDVQ